MQCLEWEFFASRSIPVSDWISDLCYLSWNSGLGRSLTFALHLTSIGSVQWCSLVCQLCQMSLALCCCIFVSYCDLLLAFSGLILLVGHREEHPACKNWVMRCWHGYLSAARCNWFAYGPADATATPSFLAWLKSRTVLHFWRQLTQVVLEKRPLNKCLSCNLSREGLLTARQRCRLLSRQRLHRWTSSNACEYSVLISDGPSLNIISTQ